MKLEDLQKVFNYDSQEDLVTFNGTTTLGGYCTMEQLQSGLPVRDRAGSPSRIMTVGDGIPVRDRFGASGVILMV